MLLFLKPSSTNMGNWAAKEPPSLAPLPTQTGRQGSCSLSAPAWLPMLPRLCMHLIATTLKQSDLMRQINVAVRALSLLGLRGAGGNENGAVGRELGDQAAG